MAIFKVIEGSEIYIYMNGNLIYKRWLDLNLSMVFDIVPFYVNEIN